MDQVKLYDTTLRDGMGGRGMSLSVGEKVKVAAALDALGAHFIEAGFPSSNPKEAELFERLAELELALGDLHAYWSDANQALPKIRRSALQRSMLGHLELAQRYIDDLVERTNKGLR